MRTFVFFFLIALSAGVALAEQPYSKEAFEKAQKNNEKILIDFYADWCPTCRLQRKSLKRLEEAGKLKGISIFIVDYDKEEDLKKSANVSNQSTLITYHGRTETGRSIGVTNEDELSAFLDKKLIALIMKRP